jgi:hypothetical protein
LKLIFIHAKTRQSQWVYYSYSANASTRGILPHKISHIYGTQQLNPSTLERVILSLSIRYTYDTRIERDVLAIELGTYVLTFFTGLYDKPVRKEKRKKERRWTGLRTPNQFLCRQH